MLSRGGGGGECGGGREGSSMIVDVMEVTIDAMVEGNGHHSPVIVCH